MAGTYGQIYAPIRFPAPETTGTGPGGARAMGANTAKHGRFGAYGAGTTGTIPAISDAGNRIGTYIYPYEPATSVVCCFIVSFIVSL